MHYKRVSNKTNKRGEKEVLNNICLGVNIYHPTQITFVITVVSSKSFVPRLTFQSYVPGNFKSNKRYRNYFVNS